MLVIIVPLSENERVDKVAREVKMIKGCQIKTYAANIGAFLRLLSELAERAGLEPFRPF